MRRWCFLAGALATVAAASAFGACNPSIDASVLDDAGADVFAPGVIACTSDKDCGKSGDSCVSHHCDTASGKCVYEVCPTGAACVATSCTTANTCGRQQTYGYQAGSFAIPEGLACPGCVGAVFPYLFIVSNTRVHAFRMTDPYNQNPKELLMDDIGFTPNVVLTSGRRVYFIGGPSGTSVMPYKLQVAWVDAPADVGVPNIRAQVGAYPYPSPDFRFDGVVAGSDDQLFSFHRVVTYENNQSVYRYQELLTHIDPGPAVPGQLDFISPTNYPANGTSVAFSNGRLAVYRSDKNVGAWSFDVPPGVNGSTNSGDTPLPTMGNPGASTFAQTAGGTVYWSAALRAPAVMNQPQLITGVRIGVPLADGGGSFALANTVDLETYAPGEQENTGQNPQNPYVGPIVPLDENTVLALAAARENVAQASVQLLTRAGGALTLTAGKRFLTKGRVDQVGTAGSNGFGYIVDPDTADSMTVFTFAAGCQ
jgi:hypothetical protein